MANDLISDQAGSIIISETLGDSVTRHNTLSLNIASGNQVSARAASVLKHLQSPNPEEKSARPAMVCMRALAPNANKLITITEIVKRQLALEKTEVYQYNILASEMVKIKSKPSDDKLEEDEDEEEEAFEKVSGKEKIRNVPSLTICLTLSPVAKLRREYGFVADTVKAETGLTADREQSNMEKT